MRTRSRFTTPLASIFVLAVATAAAISQPCDRSTGTFPTAAPGTAVEQSVSRIEYIPPSGGQPGRYEWKTTPPLQYHPIAPVANSEEASYPTPAPVYTGASWADFYELDIGDATLDGSVGTVSIPDIYPLGFSLGLNRLVAPALGDFLSPSPTIGGSSLALVPHGSEGETTGWQGSTRATLEGVVDLVTGLPLVQVTDLELPFGGATFRLNRTRSANHQAHFGHPGGLPTPTESLRSHGRWWDWVGEGWMASENPIFLFDAALADVTGDGPRTSWLWLDAHHSIPFQQVYHPASGGSASRMEYEAPPRFRARLEHNGVWQEPTQGTPPGGVASLDDAVGKWGTPPTQVDIWLYDGLVHYTFAIIYEDMPPNVWDRRILSQPVYSFGTQSDWEWTSFHDRPFTQNQYYDLSQTTGSSLPGLGDQSMVQSPRLMPGRGVPHYGLCVRIRDRNGNCAETTYAPFRRYSIDDPSTACVETIEDSRAKGQISYIKLVDAAGQPQWTLLYAHRRFPRAAPHDLLHIQEFFGELRLGDNYYNIPGAIASFLTLYSQYYAMMQEIHGFTVIDRIYAFNRDIPEADLVDLALVTPVGESPSLEWGGTDPLTEHNANLSPGQSALPTDWVHQVRYHYDVPWTQEGTQTPNPPANHPNLQLRSVMPNLLKTSVRTRGEGVLGSPGIPAVDESVRSRAFVYGALDVGLTGGTRLDWLWLVFEDEDLAAARNAGVQVGGSLIDAASATTLDIGSPGAESEERAIPFASLRFEPVNGGYQTFYWPEDDANEYVPPSDTLLVSNQAEGRPYLSSSTEYWSDMQVGSTVAAVAVGSVASGQRYYRTHHIAVPPGNGASADSRYAPFRLSMEDVPFERMPGMSVFSHPYPWQSEMLDGVHPTWAPIMRAYADSPDLTKARWISVIDELSIDDIYDLDAIDGPVFIGDTAAYDVNSGIKPGQLSRKVVEMSASGHVLGDRTWSYSEAGVVRAGGGLGEKFIYAAADDLFAGTTGFQPQDPDFPTLEADRLGNVWGELLLVERRSVGWSAAEAANNGESEGLVFFDEYDLVPDDSATSGFRIQAAGDGMQRGIGSPLNPPTRMYSGKTLEYYDASTNTESMVRLDFTEPVLFAEMDLLSLSSTPTLSYLQTLPSHYQASVVITVRDTAVDPDYPDMPDRSKRIVSRTTIAPPRHQRPAGTAAPVLFFPVEKEWYDVDGSALWSATGLVANPFNPLSSAGGDLNSLVFTYYDRFKGGFGAGESRHTVVDAVPGSHPTRNSSSVVVPFWPESGWEVLPQVINVPGDPFPRVPRITSFVFDRYGLSDAHYANGLHWARRIIKIPRDKLKDIDVDSGGNPVHDGLSEAQIDELPPMIAREYIFKAVDLVGNAYVTGEVCEIIDHSDEEPVSPLVRRRVEYPGPVVLDIESIDDESSYVRLAATRLGVDSFGRLRKAELLEWVPGFGWMDVGTKLVNDLGEVYRELELDGTITRITRNAIGQDLRRYVGTRDLGWVSELDGNGIPLPYNMALVERTEYGTGAQDAWLPTIVREYRSNPAWARDHYEPVAGVDSDGIATVIGYDWRMRAVRTDRYAQGDPASAARLETSIKYLDHMGRELLTATYGEGPLVLGTLDPTTFGPIGPPVSVAALYGFGVRPNSVMEYIYDRDGSRIETRQYDTSWSGTTGTPPYHAEYQYRGFGGEIVFTQRPASGAMITRLDGLGRQKSVATVAPGVSSGADPYGFELSRIDFAHDEGGNVVDVRSWERFDSTGDVLDEGNAVLSRTVHWYDRKERLLATAELGTESDEGFVSKKRSGDSISRYIHAPTVANAPKIDADGFDVAGVHRGPVVPADVPLWIYKYNNRGERTHVASPSGSGPVLVSSDNDIEVYKSVDAFSVTFNEFSGLGRLTRKIENAGDVPNRRVTEYTHLIGRLDTIKAFRTASQSQETKVEYGADVLDDAFNVVSQNNGLIARLWLPDEQDGSNASQNAPSITLSYDFQGRVVQREDARGVVKRYRYDDRGLITDIEIGHYVPSLGTFAIGYPTQMDPVTGAPADRIGFVSYTYDSDGMVETVTARTVDGAQIITQNEMAYDDRGQLLKEWQSFGTQVAPLTPVTEYTWDYQPTIEATAPVPGHLRLATVAYPKPQSSSARSLAFNYGIAGGADDVMSRVTAIDSTVAGVTERIADFEYSGTGRRIARRLADGSIEQRFKLGVGTDEVECGFFGLDRFGRVRDLHTTALGGSSPATLHRVEYEYDLAGNRISTHLEQAVVGGVTSLNVRSERHVFDGLNRLVRSEYGTLTADGAGDPVIDGVTRTRSDDWGLDLLGNWTGGAAVGITGPPGRVSDGNLDGWGTPWQLPAADAMNDAIEYTHAIDEQNRLTALEVDDGTVQDIHHRCDDAGNLIFDGEYFYQYDAWNRLIQINQASIDPLASDPATEPIAIGVMVKHYTYDGFGRLVRTQSPFPNASSSNNQNRTERFYYDGVRRVIEYNIDPIISGGPGGGGPGGGHGGDQSAVNFGEENSQINGIQVMDAYQNRAYIWGPGDGLGGVDELLVQFDRTQDAVWVIQDAGGDIVAACDLGGTGGEARVVSQWTYDSYGAPLSTDRLGGHADLYAGHKGLFVDRLDTGVANIVGGPGRPRIVPFAKNIVHNRNRAYNPSLGRFMQADPNATGAVVLADVRWFEGASASVVLRRLSLSWRYADGANLQLYLRANPFGLADPMGLTAIGIPAGGGGGASSATAGAAALGGVLLLFMVDQYASSQSTAVYATEQFISGAYGQAEALYEASQATIELLGEGLTVINHSRKTALGQINKDIPNIVEHLAKLEQFPATGGPNDPRNHWIDEILGWMTRIERRLPDVGKKTARGLRDQLDEWYRVLREHGYNGPRGPTPG